MSEIVLKLLQPQQFTYRIKQFKSFNITLDSGILSMPISQRGADETVLIKLRGNTKKISIVWTLYDSQVSVVDEAEVKTAKEQYVFLTTEMENKTVRHRYSLTILNDITYYGVITNLSIDTSSDKAAVFDARLDFMVGNVLGVRNR